MNADNSSLSRILPRKLFKSLNRQPSFVLKSVSHQGTVHLSQLIQWERRYV